MIRFIIGLFLIAGCVGGLEQETMAVEKQNSEVNTLCVPYTRESPEKKMQGVFDLFFNLIKKVEKMESTGECVKERL